MEPKRPKCIICNEHKDGLPIVEDSVVRAIRWLNAKTFKYSNPSRPVVCRQCFTKHRRLRKSFERKRVAYVIIGVLFAVTLGIVSKGNPFSVLAGLGMIAFMYLLSIVSYVPAVEIPASLQHANATGQPKKRNPAQKTDGR